MKMLKQKYANGYWIGLTTGVCAPCLSLYHFVPFAFVMAIILSVLFCTGFAIAGSITALSGAALVIFKVIAGLTGLMWVLYGLLAVIMALAAVIGAPKIRNKTCLALPFLFLMLHVSYGTGTVIGLIKMPFWVKGIKNGRN